MYNFRLVTKCDLNVIFLFRNFESVLNVIKWPYLGSTSTELINPTKESLHKLVTAAEHLFLVGHFFLYTYYMYADVI